MYKKIAKFIMHSFSNVEQPLDEYIIQILPDIVRDKSINITEDEYIYYLCGGNPESYKTFIKMLKHVISNEKGLSKVILWYDAPVYYLQQTGFGEKVITSVRDKYNEKLRTILKDDKFKVNNKGEFFERFCSYFLKDIGIDNWVTKRSKDEGIDIVGLINGNSGGIRDLVLKHEQFLLVQVKYYANSVDSSVIRHLIGDGSFYRNKTFYLNEQRYFIGAARVCLLVIAFSGFSECAEQMARTYNVETLDGDKIVDVLCSIGEQKSRALNFLSLF
ncbi:restriction endonuclease [Priestia megaterium]|uniref:restriction endonuclease n=1 Tax=Priestia megaterium TaxID=1404 RepID=UPI003EEF754F